MATNLAIPGLTLVSTEHPAPFMGAASSEDWNDSEQERLLDLISIIGFINNVLIPIINLLPSSAAAGLQGSSIYSDTTNQTSLFYDNVNNSYLTISQSLSQLNTLLGNQSLAVSNLSALVGQLQQQLSASDQYDLSIALNNINASINQMSATQINLNNAISVLRNTQTTVVSETPGGATPGMTFTITYPSANGALLALYSAGELIPNTQYTLSGQTITTEFTVSTADNITVLYNALINS